MTRAEAARRFAEKAEDHYYVPKLREMYQMAADALSEPEIIRCKDCKYGEDTGEEYLCHYNGSDWNSGEHFCSRGERIPDHE